MERTISGMMGKGSVNHNTRAFSAKNVDKERSRDNVEFCHKDIKAVYHELFDEALERYNAKQKRSDRKIDNYYEKIRQGKQEKLFHEVIFQIGNKDDMNVRSEEGQLAKQILSDFMADFQSRNPNLHVFSAHLHMDEETPHIHIDFVPVITGSKRGLDTRVSLKGALAAQGFEGGTRGATEWNQWIESEKKELAAVMERYGVEWLQKGTHKKHLSVLDYEKQERAKEVAELDSQLAQSERALQTASKMVDNQFARVEELAEMGDKFQRRNEEIKADNAELEKTYVDTKQSYNSLLAKNSQLIFENEDLELEKERRLSGNRELEKQQQKLQKELEAMAGSKVALERNVRAYDEDRQWQLPEPGVVQSAKAYREKVALPLITRLKEIVKNRSEGAINETIDKYSKLLWSIIGKVLNNIGSVQDIEECVADTFIYLWENPHKFDPSRGKLKSWLSIIARTKAIDRCREIAKTRTISLESTILVSDLGIVDDMIQEETRRVLIAAVNALGEPDREILVRRYYYEQKPKEIALALNLSVKQVNNRLYQTKQKLREALSN